MIVVIIAGGSGTRLWPLSTPSRPKHLLTIDGDDLSLLQQTYERAKQLSEKVYIVSESSHIDEVKQQLSELPAEDFIIEPARRGTANCLVAAIAAISKLHDNDEPIVSIHADHYIRDSEGFTHSLKTAGRGARLTSKRIRLSWRRTRPAGHGLWLHPKGRAA